MWQPDGGEDRRMLLRIRTGRGEYIPGPAGDSSGSSGAGSCPAGADSDSSPSDPSPGSASCLLLRSRSLGFLRRLLLFTFPQSFGSIAFEAISYDGGPAGFLDLNDWGGILGCRSEEITWPSVLVAC